MLNFANRAEILRIHLCWTPILLHLLSDEQLLQIDALVMFENPQTDKEYIKFFVKIYQDLL